MLRHDAFQGVVGQFIEGGLFRRASPPAVVFAQSFRQRDAAARRKPSTERCDV